MKPFVFIKNKLTILKKKRDLKEDIKVVEECGGKVKIKNNEYIGGTTIEIELPVEKKDIFEKSYKEL
ncbi:MAG TPA: hypothetical protein PLQ72_00035 [Candidatus Pacearchaeota archaeon]|nr:hypothetical protein [Candidatus Pacearchaeota archaeon]